ncbi:M48 family metalloprotease [Chitinophaga oryziterrae]|uniref:M48 family metalloprotease n=1 Tax=Chitinophaga oryziterrae TaxID=1031224 RepID=A0A6N8J415_9BACT|nr:M56 family metallopeptidase [Chitinophaga oryziterrae]MVT39985.1 M48 family metalloprotease [Chitinophaga oryziterrae]
MTASLPFTADLIQAFGWALLHSLWQALLIYACLRLVLLLWPQASSAIKYNLSFISLTGIFGWFVITLWEQLQTIKKIHLVAIQMVDEGIRPARLELPVLYHSQTQLTSLFPNLEFFFPLLIVIYITGVAVMTIKLTMDLLQLRQIRRKQVLPIDSAWERHLDKLLLQLQLSRKVKLLISEHVQVPVMIGFLKPLIILPVIMFNNLTAEQLEAILLHELAHIKRNDYLLNIFQSIVETILFFNPFIWLISKNIRIEREHCCDDLVITGKVHPLHYAKALVALEEYRLTVNTLAMAAANNKQHLFHRIKRIMEMKTKNINYTQKLLAVLIIAVGLVSIAWLNPTSAMTEKKQPTKDVEVIPESIAPAIVPNTIHLATFTKDTVPATKQQAEKQHAEKTKAEKLDIAEKSLDAAKIGMEAAQEAMKNIDWNQINAEVNNAIKNINWDEINENVQTAMKNIDWNKINEDIKVSVSNAQTSVDPKIIAENVRIGMQSAKAALANFSSEDVKKQVAEAMEQAKKEVAKAQISMTQSRHSITQSNKEIAATKEAQSKYQLLIKKMAEDKLIDAEKGYVIAVKNGVLSINGEVQSAAVKDKYSKELGNVKELSIQGKDDNLIISEND